MTFTLRQQLNGEQYRAATTLDGPLLVIAGAGSGKTRMLTHRIAYMLDQGIAEEAILALTFTNKAAAEMAERVRELVGLPLKKLTTSTFHAFGVRILREFITTLGWRNNFTIYDSSDRLALIKEVILDLDYVVESFDLWKLSALMSDVKTGRATLQGGRTAAIYAEYEQHLKAYNAVDFDDLIVKPLELFTHHPAVLQTLQGRYTHILVDEFQDTSLAQYGIISTLAKESRNLCVVGDDDQSIYSWRGANYENIEMFERDFPERLEITLDRNYRSTGIILEAANALIVNNTVRKEKQLWTDGEQGSSIRLIHPANGQTEASIIADEILMANRREDRPYNDFAILVRTNSLLDMIETTLTERGIPTQVTGGLSFFDRKEIRDVISYIKVLANPNDDINTLRVINTPRRGIGRTTLEHLRSIADAHNASLMGAAQLLSKANDSEVREATRRRVATFVELMEEYRHTFFHGERPKHIVLRALLEAIDYQGHIEAEHPENEAAAAFKMKGVQLLCDMLARFEREHPTSSIFEFLSNISLAGRESESEEDAGKVALMTIHAAKGLEWDTVYVVAVEDHILPHARALEENPKSIDEERRLFYVAITRARRALTISSCEARRRGPIEEPSLPSRFLEEIPASLFDEQDPNKELSESEMVDKLRLLRERLAAQSS
ncbi:MAG TPA: UvrD-helicase domain-containing protein [Sphaerochaeta sp.]|nr:UvrD-helicase domain-containing protein [Sphaerochaeta sp.]